MTSFIDSFLEYIEVAGDEEYELREGHNEALFIFKDRIVTILADGSIRERKRQVSPHDLYAVGEIKQEDPLDALIAMAKRDGLISDEEDEAAEGDASGAGGSGGNFVSRFSEAEYPHLLTLVEQKAIFKLDFSARYSESVAEEYVEWFDRPNYHWFGELVMAHGQPGGNPFVWAARKHNGSHPAQQDWIRNRFKMLDDVGFELTYYPLHPDYSDQNPQEFFDSTRLSEVMTFEEFQEELDNDAEWLDAITSSQEVYDCIFEVFPSNGDHAAREQSLDEATDTFGDLLFDEPLTVKSGGQEFEFYVWQHED